LIIASIAGFACRDNPIGPDSGDLHLSAEDIGVTDLWLRVKIDESNELRTITLTRDGQILFAVQYSALDTLILCDSLLPRHTYKYTAILTGKNIFSTSYAELTVTTLDTTTHDFTWEVDTLGDGANSSLRDVAIVNDTCVWAVGELYLRDSMGQFETEPYNAARWDGQAWHLLRVPTRIFGGSIATAPLTTVFGFSPSDIWVFSVAGSYSHWDGSAWSTEYVPERSGGGTKFWGTSSFNLFLVGTNGSITYYNGSTWQKMESGTDVDLLDVWGSPDGSVVWACGYYRSRIGTYLLCYTGTTWEVAYDGTNSEFLIRTDSLSGAYSSVYTPSSNKIFVCTSAGIYSAPSRTRGEAKLISFPSTWSGFPWRLRGNAVNDVVLVGEYYMLGHFNGVAFKHYNELGGYGRLASVYQRDNFVVAVGYSFDPIHSRGIVFRGRR